ncbi:HAD family hydrolase [Cellulomonas oligotrophica]|uniref:HAD superfamily hydrolase (TIGR01509 family) n=1 Tax=Cellulomonas oligotrophica TaxID=931536 RepID=A0A7Y9FD17_9CELL|nr:HAD family phosphatase [Cellulomonas oligotrophica]NYD84899.1 HAD superfamily hydrolase (TIGR01509 family) [Cellulomonas oligotrophica]GIG31968.1 haloacid dehalogenase [Cellulomonas oligotrophica]
MAPARDHRTPDDLPAAVLWDMDGTLIDSEPHWMVAETELVEAHGGVWTRDDAVSMIGSSMDVAAARLRERGVDLSTAQIADALNTAVAAAIAAGVPWQPGARELVEAVAAAGVPQALVTSSYRVLAEPFARAVGLFDVVVAGDDVTRPKPDPEPYLTAAALLGVDPRACVALEDSVSGLASAVASGAHVVAVQLIAPVDPPAGVSRTTTLRGVTLADLARVASGQLLDRRAA